MHGVVEVEETGMIRVHNESHCTSTSRPRIERVSQAGHMYITRKTFGCDQPVRDLMNFGRPFCRNTQDLRLIRIAMGIPGIAGRVRVQSMELPGKRGPYFFADCTAVFAEMGTSSDHAHSGSREKRVCV